MGEILLSKNFFWVNNFLGENFWGDNFLGENFWGKNVLGEIFFGVFFFSKIFLVKIFLTIIFLVKIFLATIFFWKGIWLSLHAIHPQHTTPTPSYSSYLKLRGDKRRTNERTYGPDGAHNDCSFYCIRYSNLIRNVLVTFSLEIFLAKIFLVKVKIFLEKIFLVKEEIFLVKEKIFIVYGENIFG